MAAYVGKLTNTATSITRAAIHYAQVGAEFGRLVAKGANLTVPSGPQFAEAQVGFGKLLSLPQNGAWKKVKVSEVGQFAYAGVTVVGFFLVGEIVGRGSIVGYKIPGAHAKGGHH